MSSVSNREWTQRFFAEHGRTMTGETWAAIESAVDAAPPIPEVVLARAMAVIRPVPPPADTPSTRGGSQRPRSRQATRAA